MMRLTTLQDLWTRKYPGARVGRGRRAGTFVVTYAPGGKVYDYYAPSVYALAERLGMIPADDIPTIAARVRAQLHDVGDSCVDLAGASDTLARQLLGTGTWVDWEHAGVDQYDRPLARYTLLDAADDLWLG